MLLVGLGRWVRSYPSRVAYLGVGPPLPHISVQVTVADSFVGEGHRGGSSSLSELEPLILFRGSSFVL